MSSGGEDIFSQFDQEDDIETQDFVQEEQNAQDILEQESVDLTCQEDMMPTTEESAMEDEEEPQPSTSTSLSRPRRRKAAASSSGPTTPVKRQKNIILKNKAIEKVKGAAIGEQISASQEKPWRQGKITFMEQKEVSGMRPPLLTHTWIHLLAMIPTLLVDHLDPLVLRLEDGAWTKDLSTLARRGLLKLQQLWESQVSRDYRGTQSLLDYVMKSKDPSWSTISFSIQTLMSMKVFLRKLIEDPNSVEYIADLKSAMALTSCPPTTSRGSTISTSSTTVFGAPENVPAPVITGINDLTAFDALLPPQDSEMRIGNVSSAIYLTASTRSCRWTSAKMFGDTLVDVRLYPVSEIRGKSPQDWWRHSLFRGKIFVDGKQDPVHKPVMELIQKMIDRIKQEDDCIVSDMSQNFKK